VLSYTFNYAIYMLINLLLASLALLLIYRIVAFLLKKNKKYLRFIDFLATVGFLLSNLYTLGHFTNFLLYLMNEGVMRDTPRLTPSIIERGIVNAFDQMAIEGSFSAFFFIMLMVILFLKNRLHAVDGDATATRP